ncbi:MAG: M1 family metallopeptidase [Saprospiraceae bacterium]|nr:M1 family metallopeptidase [Saprospiraceae bacterium]
MKIKTLSLLFLIGLHVIPALSQPDRWQQRVVYKMDIAFDVATHRFEGKQELRYTNNSPDTLSKVFYHLYFNAFQPGSAMDVRSRNILDPDSRVADRIFNLKPEETGYHHINSLFHRGKPVKYVVEGTILEVELQSPILPGETSLFEMKFSSQVPIHIRRSGRDNSEGIDYSMAQWYPKLCEYDYQGWHANPYIAREFYGVWGDFEIRITIDKNYVIGATGYLQNPDEIGHGYESEGQKVKHKGKNLTWHFVAPNVHDFVWSADRDYKHTVYKRKDGIELHCFYQPGERTTSWAELPAIMDKALDYIQSRYGPYPYKQYSFLQGGDGGMEYPMATLITGNRPLQSLVGVSIHEIMHSWYQMILGTNESLYAWMDEGFTDYTESEVANYLRKEKILPGAPAPDPHAGQVSGYTNFAKSGYEEPLITHADHFQTNAAYSVGAYTKGALFLHQLNYIIGKQAFDRGMLRYYYDWRFKHPNVNDFIRVMEKESGLELDWYKEYWVNTTHNIDYGIKSVTEIVGHTQVILQNEGLMPMPLDVVVTYTDGSKEVYNIALDIMRGNKPAEPDQVKYNTLPDWPWVNPEYTFMLTVPKDKIANIVIDPSGRMVDFNKGNNSYKK